MSKIRDELVAASGLTAKRGQADTDFLPLVLDKIGDLDDKAWNKLSAEAQAYYNEAVESLNEEKGLPKFPDDEPEVPATTKRATRGAAKAEAPKEPAVGDQVRVINARDKEFTGELLELDADTVVIEVDGKEMELVRAKLKTFEVVGGAGKTAAEPEGPAEPVVGAEVEVVNARDKTLVGKILEMDDDTLVLEIDGKESELVRAKLKSIKVLSGGKVASKAPDRASKATKGEPEGGGEGGKEDKAQRAGNGTGQRVRELILDNLDSDADAICKVLTKEGVAFREQTVKLVYAETHKLIAMMKTRKMLK